LADISSDLCSSWVAKFTHSRAFFTSSA
jgi:hypothetical protein